MCGIAGIIGIPRHSAQAAVQPMLGAMVHRGPDGLGSITIEINDAGHPVHLLHSRLAVIDLSAAGTQPMCLSSAASGGVRDWIVFNGEIYNFLELRAELEERGAHFSSRCDTEVILHAYQHWGVDCVQRLRGMFAFCLVSPGHNLIWLCRDRLGIKPLYLCILPQGGLVFASEVRTILAAGRDMLRPSLNRAAVEAFLAQGAVFSSQSIVSGIELLSPGESLLLDLDGRTLNRTFYWTIAGCAPERQHGLKRRDAVHQTTEELRQAVSQHLISDVPLGIFLSSGIDSTALAAVATEVHDGPVHTITLGFDQEDYDEAADAERIAKHLGTEHQTVRISGSFILDHLDAALHAMDQPTVDGFNTYFVSKATRAAGLTVALSGLGGDELFCGYASFRDVGRALRLRRALRLLRPCNALFARLGSMCPGRSGAKLSELWQREMSALGCYLLRRELFLPEERRALHALPPHCDSYSGLPSVLLSTCAADYGAYDIIQQVSRFELALYMQHMLLRDSDVFSMASALEIRVPYLDHHLVEQVLRTPSALKWDRARPKSLLIDAAGRRFPEFARTAPKRGFAFPWGAWLRGPLADRARGAAANRELWEVLGINHKAVAAILQRFLAGDSRILPLQVLAFIVLEHYAQKHMLCGAQ